MSDNGSGGDSEKPKRESNQKKLNMNDITGVGTSWTRALLVPALALLTALIVGAFIIAVSDLDLLALWTSNPGQALADTWGKISGAYSAMFRGAFGDLQGWSETLTLAAPLILAGLSVAVGFKAGLFNIGAEGQMVIGGLTAVVIGFSLDVPGIIHVPLAVLGGFIGGFVWGAIPGLLRAKTGAHEVITTIMLNFVALNLLTYLLKSSAIQQPGRDDARSKLIQETARLPRLLSFMDDPRLRVHLGILIALAAAGVVYWMLFKTTLGFEIRAVGANPDASRYAGMNVLWLYVAAMGLAGGLAGLAGVNPTLGLQYRATPGFSAAIGFDAIALALLGRSHPLGVVFAGILFGALRSGGQEMQAATGISIDLVLVVGALIVIFIAAPALIRSIYRVKTDDVSVSITKGIA
ncbi:D-allose transporter subunit [bacterium BMS3Bbin02]|nr:D-allose transporter subunit [bacterium BMS3Bbin02]